MPTFFKNSPWLPIRFVLSVLLLFVLILTFALSGSASQQLGHIFMALTAYEDAPEELWSILFQNLDYYIAGATGPDIALISFPLEELQGRRHPGDWPHYYKTGDFVMNMLDLAETPAEKAFAWGWLTHYIVDSTIHPLVNAYGGYYTGDTLTKLEQARAKERHVRLELFENRHVIEIAGESSYFPHRYRVDHKAVPTELIAATYYMTYGRAPDDFIPRLWAASLAMEVTTESFIAEAANLRTRRRLSDFLSPIPAMFLEKMPTAEEYDQLMNPLIVEDVQLFKEDDELFLTVAYRVNDLRLHKGFAEDWDATYPQAVTRIRQVFTRHESEPRQLGLPNLDMDIGLPEGEIIDPLVANPGYPEIFWMLVKGSVTNEAGRELSPLVYSDFWVDFEHLEENVWGGPAGTGTFKIPIDHSEPGPYNVSLSLSFSDLETGIPYFDAGPKSRFEGTIGGEQRWVGQLAIQDSITYYHDGVRTWQEDSGVSIPLTLFSQQTANSIEVTRLMLDGKFYINRGVLVLLPPPWMGETRLMPAQIPQLIGEYVTIWETTMGYPSNEEEPPAWLQEVIKTTQQQSGEFRLEFVATADLLSPMLFSPRPVETLTLVGLLDLEAGTVSGVVQGNLGGTPDIVGTWTAQQVQP